MASDPHNIGRGLRRISARSQGGCQTCRERKVKCDETRPSCSPRTRLGRPCSWTRKWIFRDRTALIAREYLVLSVPQDSNQYDWVLESAETSLQWQPPWNGNSREAAQHYFLKRPPGQIQTLQALRARASRLPAEINSANTARLQLLNSALYHFLPYDEYNLGGGRSLEESPSINMLRPHDSSISNPQSLALKAAIDAFSLAQAALVLKEARFASASVRRYVVGVAALRSGLIHAQDSTRDETILAMMIFQLIEIIGPTSSQGGWTVHAAGAQRFVESLGPWHLHTHYQCVLFDQVRQAAVIWGIAHRKEIPFAQNKWISMSKVASSITSERQLIDISTIIPGLLVVAHDLYQNSDAHEDRFSVWQDLKDVQRALLAWIHDYDTQGRAEIEPCDAIHFPVYHSHMGTTEDMLKHAFMFPNFNKTWFMSTAWIYLYAVQNALLRVLQVINITAPGNYLDELRESMHTTVWNLCYTTPQLLDQSSGFPGRMCISLSSDLRKMYFEAIGDVNMVLWCQKLDTILHAREKFALFWTWSMEFVYSHDQ